MQINNPAISFEKINPKSPEIMAALARAPIFKKQVRVQARPAVEGEQIATKLANGSHETTHTAKAGAWVMTNPSGEQYIISKEKFFDRYEPTDAAGIYRARGYCRAIPNPFGKPIEIMASWGAPQTGDEHCLIADTCDANGGNMGGEPYLIDGKVFAQTYAPAG